MTRVTINTVSEKVKYNVILHEQRIKTSHMLSDGIDNQIYIIAEIGQKLRTKYKDYLK